MRVIAHNPKAVLEALVTRLPPPQGDEKAPLKALLIDSWYDPYLGVVALVRVKDGVLKKGLRVRMMSTGAVHEIERVGYFTPKRVEGTRGRRRCGPAAACKHRNRACARHRFCAAAEKARRRPGS